MQNLLCLFLTLTCPPYNVEFIDSQGECVYVCIDGRPICPCVTGPFDDMHEAVEIDIVWNVGGANVEVNNGSR